MARYIDADALIHEYYKNPTYPNLCKAINDAPTADVVEVVRCKECKHSSQKVHICEITNYLYGANYFCAWGERRTDDGEIH